MQGYPVCRVSTAIAVNLQTRIESREDSERSVRKTKACWAGLCGKTRHVI
jgi:hypothetical protein